MAVIVPETLARNFIPSSTALVSESAMMAGTAVAGKTVVLPVLPVNVAVTLRAAVMDTAHVPVPVHAPLQPVKVEPVVAAAVRVTLVPLV